MITPELLQAIRAQYRLRWEGTHGVAHWARVYTNGLRLAELCPAVRPNVVELFAVLHDAARQNEGVDHGHGRRGADLAAALRGQFFWLADHDFALLTLACRDHTAGATGADITVQVCWDADRLDLPRVGIIPLPEKLCTPAARDPQLTAWAAGNARRRWEPPFAHEWLAAVPLRGDQRPHTPQSRAQ